MKKRLYILVVLIAPLLVGFIVESWVVNQYVFNNTDFTASFCENKAKPELQCNGSCAVMKVLQADANQSNKEAPKEVVEQQDLTWIIPTSFKWYFFEITSSNYVRYNHILYQTEIGTPFRPPC